jgi:hypothetical protein
MAEEPSVVWNRLEEHLMSTARAYIKGDYSAEPKLPAKECARCMLADLCGLRRRIEAIHE